MAGAWEAEQGLSAVYFAKDTKTKITAGAYSGIDLNSIKIC